MDDLESVVSEFKAKYPSVDSGLIIEWLDNYSNTWELSTVDEMERPAVEGLILGYLNERARAYELALKVLSRYHKIRADATKITNLIGIITSELNVLAIADKDFLQTKEIVETILDVKNKLPEGVFNQKSYNFQMANYYDKNGKLYPGYYPRAQRIKNICLTLIEELRPYCKSDRQIFYAVGFLLNQYGIIELPTEKKEQTKTVVDNFYRTTIHNFIKKPS